MPPWSSDYACERLHRALPDVMQYRKDRDAVLVLAIDEEHIRCKWIDPIAVRQQLADAAPQFLPWMDESRPSNQFRSLVFFPDDSVYAFTIIEPVLN